MVEDHVSKLHKITAQVAGVFAVRCVDDLAAEVDRLRAQLVEVAAERDEALTRAEAARECVRQAVRDDAADVRVLDALDRLLVAPVSDETRTLAAARVLLAETLRALDEERKHTAAILVEEERLRAQLARVTEDRDALIAHGWRPMRTIDGGATEGLRGNDALWSIINGRGAAPSDAEIAAHASSGGRWLVATLIKGKRCVSVLDAGVEDAVRHAYGPQYGAVRWWSLAASGMLCAWPAAASEGTHDDVIEGLRALAARENT